MSAPIHSEKRFDAGADGAQEDSDALERTEESKARHGAFSQSQELKPTPEIWDLFSQDSAPRVPEQHEDSDALARTEDSLSSVEFRNRLTAEAGAGSKFPNALMFYHPTLRAITDLVQSQIQPATQPLAAPAGRSSGITAGPGSTVVSCNRIAWHFPGGEGLEIWSKWLQRHDAITEIPYTRFDLQDFFDPDMEVGSKKRAAFLCTGQGSQRIGMGKELYATEESFRSALDACAEMLDPLLEKPLLDVLFKVPFSYTLPSWPARSAFSRVEDDWSKDFVSKLQELWRHHCAKTWDRAFWLTCKTRKTTKTGRQDMQSKGKKPKAVKRKAAKAKTAKKKVVRRRIPLSQLRRHSTNVD